MKITLRQIKELNPCASRLEHFKRNYPNFKGSLEDFLSLEHITYSDKVWVCVRLMTKNQKFYWARACATSVLEIFESRRLNDSRVKDLLDYLNTLDDVNRLSDMQLAEIRRLRSAAYAAGAYAAAFAGAYADAAYAGAYAAAYAADDVAAGAAAYAADAAYAYAATGSAAYAADAAYAGAYADDAAYAYAARQEQEEFNLIILAQIMQMEI
jgi:hypothetical protein